MADPEIPEVDPMFGSMIGVEYNAWMSLMAFIEDRLEDIASTYGLTNITIGITSSYPKDLTKFSKPSIIVQKIGTDKVPFGMGSFLGTYSYTDGDDVITDYDISGEIYDIEFQLNVLDSSLARCEIITSMLEEDILNRVSHRTNALSLKIYNYINSVEDPPEVGLMEIVDKINAIQLASNETRDYETAIRVSLRVVRHIVDNVSDYVDLSKIGYEQTIKL